jgi:hypothetical protein
VRARRRWLGWSLLAYGVLGVAMMAAGTIIGLDVADRVERLATDADTTLDAASRATRAAADSFDGVDLSLEEAGASSAAAAALARRSESTLDALAAAMELSILGAQPLLPLAGDFAESADLAGELAATLDAVGTSLGDTRADVADIGVELEALADELEVLGDRSGSTGAPPMRLFVGLLLAWLAVPVAASLVAGVALLRSGRAPVSA